MYLIVGLGNPGDKYKGTRHNVGFDTIDVLAEKYDISVTKRRGRAFVGKGLIEDEKVILAKPQTYMNLSGESVSRLIKSYGLDTAHDLIVICDDIYLACGNLRIRKSGSAGGHNGMKDIIARTHSDEFPRVRIGVGGKPEGTDLVKHVLGHFSKSERERVDEAAGDAAAAVAMMVKGETDAAMNKYNRKKY
ncbi:MAG: aminoacyl-tRNA hydrolase [Clostridiales bacterium]|nr:aminoacyl-tRNA hydrolase [Clostridiales bacterium]